MKTFHHARKTKETLRASKTAESFLFPVHVFWESADETYVGLGIVVKALEARHVESHE
ncbi:MAG: hypothetical protein ABR907_04215 [Terracidiphilus sp.]